MDNDVMERLQCRIFMTVLILNAAVLSRSVGETEAFESKWRLGKPSALRFVHRGE